ncbi:uncharacterized protein LOC121478658 isoform X1 [Vulpes lagopus]|uniref:uncharacterized protein LOC121478658 isoform X1 n=1 Tax=Vulpes lagopus TaxID=494514 RepID=UPI001BCA3A77|nr:uncharacterized protein LOC121478658 isoform X1 [Vulpes lagopus]
MRRPSFSCAVSELPLEAPGPHLRAWISADVRGLLSDQSRRRCRHRFSPFPCLSLGSKHTYLLLVWETWPKPLLGQLPRDPSGQVTAWRKWESFISVWFPDQDPELASAATFQAGHLYRDPAHRPYTCHPSPNLREHCASEAVCVLSFYESLSQHNDTFHTLFLIILDTKYLCFRQSFLGFFFFFALKYLEPKGDMDCQEIQSFSCCVIWGT